MKGSIVYTVILLYVLSSLTVLSQDLPNPAPNLETIPAGSFVVPMDTNLQNIVPAGVAPFNLKSYGLVNYLLQNGVPVKWVIKSGKNLNDIDFSAQAECVAPSYIAPAVKNFIGGPFIIPDTTLCNGTTTLMLIQAFANNVTVYRLSQSVTADVRYTITHRPKIAVFNNGGNQKIHTTYLDEAGIPNYDVMDAADINNLYNCYTFASEPHWAIATTNPAVITGVRNFAMYGGNVLIECAAIENYENTGLFMSTMGISIINYSPIKHVYHNADLAYMQFHGYVMENQGGSTDNWTLDTGSTWKGAHYRAISHTNIDTLMSSGIKLRAPAAIGGNVYYLGAHNYFRVQGNTYNNSELLRTNAVRMYLNAVFVPAIDNNVWANAGLDKTIACGGGSITLGCTPSATPGAAMTWSPSTGLSCTTCPNPVASPTVTTTYTLSVTGGNGCGAIDTIRVMISPMTLTVTPAPTTCSLANGSAVASLGGGQAPYTYSWFPGGQTAATATGFSGGTYTVVATDASGCTKTATVSIAASVSPSVAITTTNSGCSLANGSGTANASGGTPGYTYLWNNGQTTSTATGLAAGSYSVTVTDMNGCTATSPVSITNFPSGPVVTASSVSVSCNGGNNGSAWTSSSGGTPPYTYSWSNGATTSQISNLAAQTYSVTVTDSNNCAYITSVVITQPPALTSIATPANVLCYGGNSGSATINANGGTSPYTYLWSNGAQGTLATGLTAGNYSASVTDANGCISSLTVTITEPAPLVLPASSTTVACNGGNDGTASVTPSGGTPGYTYSWSGGQTSPAISGLSAGNYSVIVTDANGCTIAASVSIAEPPPIVLAATSTNSHCSIPNGTASVSGSGGTPGYIYLWTNGQTTATATGLGAGTYSVTVTDVNGCTKTAAANVFSPNAPVGSSSANPVSCFGGSDGSAVVNASGGTPAYTYLWNNGQTTPSITGLGAGTYSVVVADSNSCTFATSVNVTQPPVITASTNSAPVCGTGGAGSATVTASGGTGALTYVWNTSPTQSSPTATALASGMYTVTVTDANGCSTLLTQSVTVNPFPAVNMTGNNVCFNNVTSFTDLSSGNNTITGWSWDFGDGKTSTSQHPAHTYAAPGTYSVTLQVTNNHGCVSNNIITVRVNPLPLANFSSPVVCLGTATCFANLSSLSSGNITGWSWNFGDPNSGAQNMSSQQSPCHTFTGTGPFTVVLTATSDSGCQSTIMQPVNLHPLPVAVFSNTAPCVGTTVSFTDGSLPAQGDPIVSWSWNMQGGAPATSASQNPTSVYATAGTYTATLIIVSNAGCKDTASQKVIIYAKPVALFSAGDSGCGSVCADFSDLSQAVNGSITSWQWSFPGGNPSASSQQNVTVCYSGPGAYGAGLIVTTNYGCKDTVQLNSQVTVFDIPKADFCISPAKAPITNPVFTFCDEWSSDVIQWMWNFGDNSTDIINTDPTHSYSLSVTNNDFYSFPVCLRVQNKHGCWDTICKTVELIPEFTFYIPNCVTPNGDGINDLFFGKSRGVKEYDIWVFDRWGNLIWDCHYEGKNTDWDDKNQDGMSSACRWNAKVESGGMDMSGNSGLQVQEDVYVWKVRLTDIFNKPHSYIGHVSVVK